MPLGLMNAPSTFPRMMDQMFLGTFGLCENIGRCGSIITVSGGKSLPPSESRCKTWTPWLKDQSLKLFVRPRTSQITWAHIYWKRCASRKKKVSLIQETPNQKNWTELRSFLEIYGYYRRFLKEFTHIYSCHYAATSTKVRFEWTKGIAGAFEALKKLFTSPPVLEFTDSGSPFLVETYVPAVAVGAFI